MPSIKIIEAVARKVASLPGYPSLRVLDLSCGDGQVMELLASENCEVEGTHFRSRDYIFKSPSAVLETATVHQGIDLSKPLPFLNEQYDVVLATEVIEHLPSHVTFCSEAARILKDGGYFLFTTPNIHRLHSRVQFMLTGEHELRGARLGWETHPEDLYSTHYNPVYFPVLHTLLHHNGLDIVSLAFTECKPWACALALLYPAVWVSTIIHSRHAFKRSHEGGGDLLRWMTDLRMLFSDQLVVLSKKQNMKSNKRVDHYISPAADGGRNEGHA